MKKIFVLLLLLLLSISFLSCSKSVQPTGELKNCHTITITLDGPETRETADPNPFLDYRLDVSFSTGERYYVVPGFYAADGNAGETSATSGNKWRVHFTPDAAGMWTYSASFRTGDNVAISEDKNAGQPTGFDGARGTFTVRETDKSGNGFSKQFKNFCRS